MGQVPERRTFTSYLIVGSGRLSKHLQTYFQFLSIPFSVWSRTDSQAAFASEASHVLLAISDSAIEPFYKEHLESLSRKTCIHFSGALVSSVISSAHPLMTFGDDPYDLNTYRAIPFVIEKGRAPFSELLPGLENPVYELRPEQKPLYHALCAMSGNFTVLLWEKVFAEFQNNLGLPREILVPYLNRVCANLALTGESVLTGPIARGDRATIDKHLHVLGTDPYAGVYRAFLNAYQEGLR